MKRYLLFYLIGGSLWLSSVVGAQSPAAPPASGEAEQLVALDFDNVDLPVLVKFIGELTGKNFLIDEQVRGKITIFSPVKIPASRAYEVFLSALELKGFTVVPNGDIYSILPAASVPPPRSMHTYTLEHADTEEIAKVLTSLTARAAPLPRRGTSSSSQEISGPVQIVTDKLTNRLIITASEEDYKLLEEMIKKLDVKRRQIYVEAVVLEATSDLLRELGTDLGALFGFKQSPNSDFLVLGGLNRDPGTIDTLSKLDISKIPDVSLSAINATAFLHALQISPEANVLSTPQILTSDRQKAEIVVAKNVPFPGAQSQTTAGAIQTTVDRKDVGVILRLTPTIMENSRVRLDIYQEISSVVDAGTVVQGVALGPTTSKRSANTNVVVNDGQTVVIGGLIQDTVSVTQRAIPFLHRIPLIGWLFKFETKRKEKVNLMIFITPYIVPETGDLAILDAIRRKKVEEFTEFTEKNQAGLKREREPLLRQMINPPK